MEEKIYQYMHLHYNLQFLLIFVNE